MDPRIPDLALMNRLATGAPKAPKQGDDIAETARQFEALFVEQMLKTMRESAGGEALFPGQSSMFREMHDRELVANASRGQGFGLAPLIEQSLRQQQARLEGAPVAAAQVTARAFPLDGYARLLPAQRIGREPVADESPTAPAASDLQRKGNAPSPERGTGSPPPVSTQPAGPRDSRLSPPAVAAGGASGASTPESFIERIWPHAQRAAAALGLDPRMLVAQAALETGWGKHIPSARDGEAGNNLFGIKAGRGWQGERAVHQTQEFVDGRMQSERAEFRTYQSIAESFEDFVGLLRGSARYAPALAQAGNNHAFAQALQRAGYATDPQYAAKITAIAHGPRLNRALAALGTPVEDAPLPGTRLAQNLQESVPASAGAAALPATARARG
jgi:peptidoglycan hydrolase FlgJ